MRISKRIVVVVCVVVVAVLLYFLYPRLKAKFVPVKVGIEPTAEKYLIVPDLPVYPGAKLVSDEVVDAPSVKDYGKRYSAIWNSNDKAAVISQWYRANLPKKGWNISVPPADPAASIQNIGFQKGEETLILSLVQKGTVCEITLDYRPSEVVEKGD